MLGYGNGEMAPGLTSPSAAEIYMAGHNILISHARAVDTYRKNFQPAQNGKIGITLNCNWTEPAPSDDPEKAKKNAEAAERSVVWNLGWFADPVYTGDYVSPQRCCTPLWYEAPTQYCCLVAIACIGLLCKNTADPEIPSATNAPEPWWCSIVSPR